MTKPKILVTSAAGKTGFATAKQLLEKEFPVRAFVRRSSPRAEMLRDGGAEYGKIRTAAESPIDPELRLFVGFRGMARIA